MYVLNSDVVLRAEPQYYGTYAAFDSKAVITEFLSEEEFEILKMVSKKTIDKSKIIRNTKLNEKDLNAFLKKMQDLRFLDKVDEKIEIERPDPIKIDPEDFKPFPVPFLSAPTTLDLFITSRCNLNCVHCFSDMEDNALHDLSHSELESIFDQLESMRVFEVRINGGEPFLHPEIDKILVSLEKRRFRRVILTNGTMLDEKKVRLLKRTNTIPTISMNDSNPEGHDAFTGVEGSFDKMIKTLRLLQKNQMQYGINTCLHNKNIERYEEIIKLAIKYDAFRIAFLDLKLTGRMKHHKEWIPTYEEYEKQIPRLAIARLKYKRKIDVSLDVFRYCRPLEESIQEANNGFISCSAGKARLSIDSKGDVYPCNLVISDPEWNMGNATRKKLKDIWFSKKWMPFRGGVRIEDLKKCRNCKDRKDCIDFYCRLLPYLHTKDFFGPHPRCA